MNTPPVRPLAGNRPESLDHDGEAARRRHPDGPAERNT